MLGPVTRAVVNRGSSTVNAAWSFSTATARSYLVTSHAFSSGTQHTGSVSRSRLSSGCGSVSNSSSIATLG
jgi:hypothetical protein